MADKEKIDADILERFHTSQDKYRQQSEDFRTCRQTGTMPKREIERQVKYTAALHYEEANPVIGKLFKYLKEAGFKEKEVHKIVTCLRYCECSPEPSRMGMKIMDIIIQDPKSVGFYRALGKPENQDKIMHHLEWRKANHG